MQNNAATLEAKTIWQSVIKLDLYLLLPATPLLGNYPKEIKTCIHRKKPVCKSLYRLYSYCQKLETPQMSFNR